MDINEQKMIVEQTTANVSKAINELIAKVAAERSGIVNEITTNITNLYKEVLTTDEAARYMGVSKSNLYKLTMTKQIPHYKTGKLCYFNRQELERWLQSNRIATGEELSQKAQSYILHKNKYQPTSNKL